MLAARCCCPPTWRAEGASHVARSRRGGARRYESVLGRCSLVGTHVVAHVVGGLQPGLVKGGARTRKISGGIWLVRSVPPGEKSRARGERWFPSGGKWCAPGEESFSLAETARAPRESSLSPGGKSRVPGGRSFPPLGRSFPPPRGGAFCLGSAWSKPGAVFALAAGAGTTGGDEGTRGGGGCPGRASHETTDATGAAPKTNDRKTLGSSLPTKGDSTIPALPLPLPRLHEANREPQPSQATPPGSFARRA